MWDFVICFIGCLGVTRQGKTKHFMYQLGKLRCPPLISWLIGDRALDFSHSDFLPVDTHLSPYYAVRHTVFFIIHVMVTRPAAYKNSQQYIFEQNKVMFRPHLNTFIGV